MNQEKDTDISKLNLSDSKQVHSIIDKIRKDANDAIAKDDKKQLKLHLEESKKILDLIAYRIK